MFIKKIDLHHFRCFEYYTLNTQKRIVLITGKNGSGKTSIIEALHYGCYVRSFRTSHPQEMCHFTGNHYAIKIQFCDELTEHGYHELISTFDGKKKGIKIDGQSVHTHQKLFEQYRVVTITDHDLRIIDDGPGERRLFIDQHSALINPEYTSVMRSFKKALEQRNALLMSHSYDEDAFLIWTKAVWQGTASLMDMRIKYLKILSDHIQKLVTDQTGFSYTISLEYRPRLNLSESWESFFTTQKELFKNERYTRRTLFGAHLDDISIIINGKESRLYGSRGQQKLLALLLKLAHICIMHELNISTVLLIDDFMADFDLQVAKNLISLISSLNVQLFITSPLETGPLDELLSTYEPPVLMKLAPWHRSC